MTGGGKGVDERRYEPVALIAKGGMARVDLAVRREGLYSRLFAVKRLYPHMRSDDEFRAMFLDEARIAGLIRHANVVSVVDVGEDSDGPFLVMEYIEGMPLHAIVEQAMSQSHELPLSMCLRIVQQVAEGLHAAHELRDMNGDALGLVHRDVSPHNILVGFDGVARVTDFGIAKALGSLTKTMAGVMKGKIGYMSPEQRRCEKPDRRSDVYSLGVVLFEVLTLRRLFDATALENGGLPMDTVPDVGDHRADAPPELVRLVFQMLANDPKNRPESAAEVARSIGEILGNMDTDARSVDVGAYLRAHFKQVMAKQQADLADALATAEHLFKAKKRRPVVLALAAAVLIGAVGLGWRITMGALNTAAAHEAGESLAETPKPPVQARTAPAEFETTAATPSPQALEPDTEKAPDEVAPEESEPTPVAEAPPPEPVRARATTRAKNRRARSRKQDDRAAKSKVPWWEW